MHKSESIRIWIHSLKHGCHSYIYYKKWLENALYFQQENILPVNEC